MKDNNEKIPKHIGIVINGSEIWSKERNLPLEEGYKRSYEKIHQIGNFFFSSGVDFVSVLFFTQDKWQSEKKQINALFSGLTQVIKRRIIFLENLEKIHSKYQVMFSGELKELPDDLNQACNKISELSLNNKKKILNICLNYDFQTEITNAIQKIFEKKLDQTQIHKGMISKYLYNNKLGKIDMMLHTGSFLEIPNFLSWQSIGAKLIFHQKYWPEFEETDASKVLKKYKQIA